MIAVLWSPPIPDIAFCSGRRIGEAARGYLTFVSLDECGRPLPVAPLGPPATPDEAESREAGRLRYEARKLARQQVAK